MVVRFAEVNTLCTVGADALVVCRGLLGLLLRRGRCQQRQCGAHDHVVQVTDSIDTFRDMLSSRLDMYHSSIGNRTNEIIKVLTLSISIFMPLSFITGIFGMNFKDFPLLEWHWGFAGVMVFMVAIWVAMMLYFRRRHWL